jgi:hypothetical protein
MMNGGSTGASAQALGFVARRRAAEAVGMVFATRVLSEEPAGLPEFAVRRPAGYVCALGPSGEAP